MLLEEHGGSQSLDNILHLAKSLPQPTADVIDDGLVFSGAKENHSVQLTTLCSDADQSSRQFDFRDCTDLSAHIAKQTTEVTHHAPVVEI
jgi:hypothetical protein